MPGTVGVQPVLRLCMEIRGIAYVYLCYGIHQMFNVVTNKKDIPHAILIRALEPVEGIDIMLAENEEKDSGFYINPWTGQSNQSNGHFYQSYRHGFIGR